MVVSVAEYLGQRTDIDDVQILPVASKSGEMCPFMDRQCDKVSKGNPPVCMVRKTNGTIWIVCEHRLCSTRQKKKVPSPNNPRRTVDEPIGLVEHQIDILSQVAKTVYPKVETDDELAHIGVKREVTIPLPESDNNYHADYVMRNFKDGSKVDEVLLEMQGGGETSATGSVTRHLKSWSEMDVPTNKFLRESTSANPIETNAWRRQQEQFLVKGNVVSQTGGKMVFAVGSLLYDYLEKRFRNANLRDLKKHNWTLCILAFGEDKTNERTVGPIPLKVDQDRLLFTNYSTFVRFLTDQGGPAPEIFEGEFRMLDGSIKIVS